jgi:hypothetical protein
MTNKQLRKKWKSFSIQFKSGDTRPMTEMFLLCWGETELDCDGKKIKVVVFDEGGMQGAPALFCQSDKDDNCVAFGWDSKKNTSVKSIVGKFVKIPKK